MLALDFVPYFVFIFLGLVLALDNLCQPSTFQDELRAAVFNYRVNLIAQRKVESQHNINRLFPILFGRLCWLSSYSPHRGALSASVFAGSRTDPIMDPMKLKASTPNRRLYGPIPMSKASTARIGIGPTTY